MVGNPSWKNPPLQEAIFEVRFPPVNDYRLFLAELINKNRELFPKIQALPNAELPSSIIISGQVRHRFIRKDKNVVFQVGPDTLSINIIRYSGFDDFLKNIRKIISSACEFIKLEKLNQVSLRYINRFSRIKDIFSTINIVSPFPNYDKLKARGMQINYTKEENNTTFISTNIIFLVNNGDLMLDINAFYTEQMLEKKWNLDLVFS